MGIINNGVRQWLFQRFSNALFVSFGVILLFVLASTDFNYGTLQQTLFTWKWYLLVVLVVACLNSVLAAWQIEGDYAKKFGFPKTLMTGVVMLANIAFFIYGVKILF